MVLTSVRLCSGIAVAGLVVQGGDRTAVATRTDEAISVDGVLDEAAWRPASAGELHRHHP
jgi:hypothetical protein